MATNAVYRLEQLGVFTPKARAARGVARRRGRLRDRRHQGTAGAPRSATPSRWKRSCPTTPARPTEPLPGFKEIQPQVFAGLYPTEASEYDSLRDALEKLKLNDSRCATSPKSARRWASASAAASSACCTWRSCRSGSSASSTRT